MAAKRRRPDSRIIALGDDKLLERLRRAAEAAGVKTVEELADLVVDSGVAARPPADPFTDRFTLEDLGARLWRVATQTPRTRRQQWFRELAPAQRIAVVTVLRQRGYAALVISNELGISETDVESIYAENTTRLGAQVLGVRLDTLVGRMVQVAQAAQQMATEKGDSSAVWRIEKELVAMMQDLGVVDRATRKVEVVDRAEEAKAHALDRLVKIAEMRAVRQAELRQIQDTHVEDLPEEIEAEFEEIKRS